MPLIKQKQIDFSSSGGGLEGVHRTYDQLVHEIAETSFTEFVSSGGKVTDIIIWTDNLKTVKIREENFNYSGNKVSSIVKKQYDDLGVIIAGETLTDTYNYSGNTVISIDSVLT